MKEINKAIKNSLEMERPNKRINVFLNEEDRRKLKELKYKYRLGYGHLIRIITINTDCMPLLKEFITKNKNLYNTKTLTKTSIKIPGKNTLKASFYNNALIMYLEKLHKNVLNEKQYSKFNNQIATEMQITEDPLWNYNEYYRLRYVAKKFDKERL